MLRTQGQLSYFSKPNKTMYTRWKVLCLSGYMGFEHLFDGKVRKEKAMSQMASIQ